MDGRPVRLGIAGLGRAFSLMLPTFLADQRVHLVAACDPREEARVQFANDFKAAVYEDIEGLAADPNVDAIYIASPHQFHALHTRVAASRGKHILVEKPMALTIAECDDMVATCDAANVHLIVGHCHSFDTPYLQTRQIIESGEVGSVKMIQALNFTDFLYRPRRPEELNTEEGGGVIFSQAAHQVDVVRLLAGSRVERVRAILGAWDPSRPTEGAYTALLWFDDGIFASLTYSGYAHFDSDEWCDWIGEMGTTKSADGYGAARRRLRAVHGAEEEARLKAAATYGGRDYVPPKSNDRLANLPAHQHFGPVVVACQHGDLRPTPRGTLIYGDDKMERRDLTPPGVPRFEVIDELVDAVLHNKRPIHDGPWARATLEVCLALLQSGREHRDVTLSRQVGLAR